MSGIARAQFVATKKAADAALVNEQVARQRVEALEAHAAKVGALLARGLLGRLKWLFQGK